jgi:hypothetical protein
MARQRFAVRPCRSGGPKHLDWLSELRTNQPGPQCKAHQSGDVENLQDGYHPRSADYRRARKEAISCQLLDNDVAQSRSYVRFFPHARILRADLGRRLGLSRLGLDIAGPLWQNDALMIEPESQFSSHSAALSTIRRAKNRFSIDSSPRTSCTVCAACLLVPPAR